MGRGEHNQSGPAGEIHLNGLAKGKGVRYLSLPPARVPQWRR